MAKPKVPEFSKNAIHILHLSDIHFNEERFGVKRDILIAQFFRTVQQHMERYRMKPDLVLIAGDIAYRGKGEEYEEAIEFLASLSALINNPELIIFSVPGERDMNRDTLFSNTDISAEASVEEVASIAEGFNEYVRFLQNAKDLLKFVPSRKDNLVYYIRDLNIRDWPISIMGMNTALFSHGEGVDSDKSPVNFRAPQISKLFDSIRLATSTKRITILLQHNPLVRSALPNLSFNRIISENSAIVFHGQSSAGDMAVQFDGMPSFTQSLEPGNFQNSRQRYLRFQFVIIDPHGGMGQVFPYRYRGDSFSAPAEGSVELAERGYISFRFREPLGQEEKEVTKAGEKRGPRKKGNPTGRLPKEVATAPVQEGISIRKVLEKLRLVTADEQEFMNLIGVASMINQIRKDEDRDRVTRTSLIFALLYLNDAFLKIMVQCGIDRERFRIALSLTSEMQSWELKREDVEICQELADALRLAHRLLEGRPLGNLELAYLTLESCRRLEKIGVLGLYLKEAQLDLHEAIDLLRRQIESSASAAPRSPSPSPAVSPPDRAAFDSDAVVRKDLRELDRLNMRDQAETFAKVLIAEEVKPPVSLGLFGDWGTGKTFFMGLMREEIEELVRKQNEDPKLPYVHRVCQIEFNAWHYIDTNLWASLATHIFNELARTIAKGKGDEEPKDYEIVTARRRLQSQVRSSEEAKEHARQDQEKAKRLLAEAERARLLIDKELESRLAEFKSKRGPFERGWRAWRAVEVELGEGHGLSEINKALGFLGISQRADTVGEMRRLLDQSRELGRTWRKVRVTAAELPALLKNWKWAVAAGVAAILVVSPEVLSHYHHLAAGWHETLARAIQAIAAFLTIGGGIFAQFRKATDALALLTKTADALQGKNDKTPIEDLDWRAEIDKLRRAEAAPHLARVTELKANVREQEEAIKSADRMIAEAGQEIQRIEAGGLVYDFLRERSCNPAYCDRLGLISTIHEDFKHLRQILDDWEGDSKKAEPQPGAADKPEPNVRSIERIILYIDDLDRCPPKVVVDVLQAVHLLLAFDLFVVVVGVDSRWLQRSLNEEYNRPMLLPEAGEGKLSVEEMREWHKFDACNYLEKIFQIPFSLAAMSDDGFVAMIEQLTAEKDEAPRTPKIGNVESAGADKEGTAAEETEKPTETALPPRSLAERSSVPGPPSPQTEKETQPPITDPAPAKPPSRPPPPSGHPAALRLDPSEKDYMKKLAGFIGTPRMIKRFVNIYRLLRVRADKMGSGRFEKFVDPKDGENRAALILLAINLGSPALGPKLMRILAALSLKEVDGLGFTELLKRLNAAEPNEGKAALGDREWELNREEIKQAGEVLACCSVLAKEDLPDNLDPYLLWAPEVGRYSYEWRLGGE